MLEPTPSSTSQVSYCQHGQFGPRSRISMASGSKPIRGLDQCPLAIQTTKTQTLWENSNPYILRPVEAFDTIIVDFIVKLPPSVWRGKVYDSIPVVDALTKFCISLPYSEKTPAEDVAGSRR